MLFVACSNASALHALSSKFCGTGMARKGWVAGDTHVMTAWLRLRNVTYWRSKLPNWSKLSFLCRELNLAGCGCQSTTARWRPFPCLTRLTNHTYIYIYIKGLWRNGRKAERHLLFLEFYRFETIALHLGFSELSVMDKDSCRSLKFRKRPMVETCWNCLQPKARSSPTWVCPRVGFP